MPKKLNVRRTHNIVWQSELENWSCSMQTSIFIYSIVYIKNGCHVSLNRIKLCSLIPDFLQVKYDFDINIVSCRIVPHRIQERQIFREKKQLGFLHSNAFQSLSMYVLSIKNPSLYRQCVWHTQLNGWFWANDKNRSTHVLDTQRK